MTDAGQLEPMVAVGLLATLAVWGLFLILGIGLLLRVAIGWLYARWMARECARRWASYKAEKAK